MTLNFYFYSSVTIAMHAFIVCAFAQEPIPERRRALPLPLGVSLESQCGAVDDLQHVETYNETLGVKKSYVQGHEASTVQLQWIDEKAITRRLKGHSPGNIQKVRWCSGTLFGVNHVLTAGHCFDIQDGSDYYVTPYALDKDGNTVYALPEALAPLQVVNFRYQKNAATGSIRSPDVYPILKLKEHRRGNLDYGIVELGRNANGKLPGETYSSEIVDARLTIKGELLALIQHPHGDPKKIEAGSAFEVRESALYYNDIDTHGGSSGAGVRDKDGKVIGVHTNAGCSKNPKNIGANKGVPASAIAKFSDFFK